MELNGIKLTSLVRSEDGNHSPTSSPATATAHYNHIAPTTTTSKRLNVITSNSMNQQPATEAKSKTITEHDLRRVLQRGKQRDTLGDKIDQALALINAVLDQLGCVYPSLHWLSS
jgi:hypothetical protein